MKKIKQLILISVCAIGTFFSSSSIYAIPPPKFTPENDAALIQAVDNIQSQTPQGQPLSWTAVAQLVPGQTPRSCRTRWTNYLCPFQIALWSREEDELLFQKYNELGPQWSKISKFFEYRDEISLKNRYNFISKSFNSFNLLNCSYRVKIKENGNKKIICELKEKSNSRVQEAAIASIDTNSTKQIYTNAPNWVPAPFSLAMNISEMQMISQVLPDDPLFQEFLDTRGSYLNDQIIKQTGTSIISSHKTLIYEDKH